MSRATLQQLAQRIRDIETGDEPLAQVATPIPALQVLLPGGGLAGGTLIEILAETDGSGAGTLALFLAKHACQRKTLVIADGRRAFYPPAAAALGIDLERTLILRPASARGQEEITALVQALRCPAVGAVIGRFPRLRAAEYRSLQLAAQSGGGVGFLLMPASVRGEPSFAGVRWFVAPLVSREKNRRLRIEVLRARGGKAGQTFVLEIDHETGDVRLPAVLASTTPLAHATRAS